MIAEISVLNKMFSVETTHVQTNGTRQTPLRVTNTAQTKRVEVCLKLNNCSSRRHRMTTRINAGFRDRAEPEQEHEPAASHALDVAADHSIEQVAVESGPREYPPQTAIELSCSRTV